jgi:uncharacterized protein (TIGR03083 family)
LDLTVAGYRELIRAEGSALLAQLERLTDEQWAQPSPCDGWDILDVIVHLQLGTMVHTRMVENGLADGMEPAWGLPAGADPREHFRRVHQEAHAEGPAANLARLRERLAGYDTALAQASDADLDRPVWFYGLPDSNLRRPIAAFTNDLIVHASDVRRPLGLEPWFSPAGSQFAGAATLAYLPMFTAADRLAGAAGIVRQTIDGVTSTVTLSPSGIQVTPDTGPASLAATTPASPASPSHAATPAAAGATTSPGGTASPGLASTDATPPASAPKVGELATDGGTWALIVWRQIPPAEAERLGRLQIAGDRALVEQYLAAIKTP